MMLAKRPGFFAAKHLCNVSRAISISVSEGAANNSVLLATTEALRGDAGANQ